MGKSAIFIVSVRALAEQTQTQLNRAHKTADRALAGAEQALQRDREWKIAFIGGSNETV